MNLVELSGIRHQFIVIEMSLLFAAKQQGMRTTLIITNEKAVFIVSTKISMR